MLMSESGTSSPCWPPGDHVRVQYNIHRAEAGAGPGNDDPNPRSAMGLGGGSSLSACCGQKPRQHQEACVAGRKAPTNIKYGFVSEVVSR
jgi:hypothetical protein